MEPSKKKMDETMSKTILKECGFLKENGTACDKSAKFGRRCGMHKGKRNKGKLKKKVETKLSKAEPKKELKTSKTSKQSSKSSKQGHTSANIKFWYMAAKKFVFIPRSECKIKRSKGRGGDQVIGIYQGKKLATYVPRGFEL